MGQLVSSAFNTPPDVLELVGFHNVHGHREPGQVLSVGLLCSFAQQVFVVREHFV